MKSCGVLLIVFFFFVGCTNPPNAGIKSDDLVAPNPSTIDETSSITTNDQGGHYNVPPLYSENPIEQASLADQLVSFNLDLSQLKVLSSGQVDWADTCLGIEQPGVDCVQEVTPGYWVLLEASGLQFEYHADKDGKQAFPATPGLSWSRYGNADNQCDKLIVFLPDTARACWCQSGEMQSITVNLLEIISMKEYDRLIASLKQFQESTINQSSPIDSESILTSLTIYGQGDDDPGSEEQQFILDFAQDIFLRITP